MLCQIDRIFVLVISLPYPPIFDWDEGNRFKSLLKHGVSEEECEEIFYDSDLMVVPDVTHSKAEERFLALGKNVLGKKLLVCFTMRNGRVRPISARRANEREIKKYEAGRA
jgi:uncharacterized DUF497 family protein